jgi:hypothetical protein
MLSIASSKEPSASAQEPTPPISRNSSTSFEQLQSVIAATKSLEVKPATNLKRNNSLDISHRLIRSKSKLAKRASSLRYQIFPAKNISNKPQTKWECLIQVQASRQKPTGPRPQPSTWIEILPREVIPANSKIRELARSGSLRVLGSLGRYSMIINFRIRSMNSFRGAKSSKKIRAPITRFSSLRNPKNQKATSDDQLSTVIADLLSYMETVPQGENAKRLKELLSQIQSHNSSMVLDDNISAHNDSIAETPPRFSRRASDDRLNDIEEEQFCQEVSETLRKIDAEGGMRSHRKRAPSAPRAA